MNIPVQKYNMTLTEQQLNMKLNSLALISLKAECEISLISWPRLSSHSTQKGKGADSPRRWLIHSSTMTQRSIQTIQETDSLLQEHNTSDKISPNIPDMQLRQRRWGEGGLIIVPVFR